MDHGPRRRLALPSVVSARLADRARAAARPADRQFPFSPGSGRSRSSAALAVPGGLWHVLFLAMHEFPQGLPFRQTGPVFLVLREVDRDLPAATLLDPSTGEAAA